ncbi:MAG TPA: C13 family peptidase, partial [Vicinamibacteria bacterium]|nr:C13 family peptidase [Vicinamibacteria bacterium]
MSALARLVLAAVVLTGFAARPAAAEESRLVIVVGLGGEPKYTDAFHELAVRMIQAAEKKMGVAAANIAYLGEKAAYPGLPVYRGRASREAVQKVLGDIAQSAGPGDLVFVLLIGHGGSQAGESRFNLPGPDMTAADFAPLLAALGRQQVVFVNTASASGDFVKALSGKGRTIVTATKSAMERNQTEFP